MSKKAFYVYNPITLSYERVYPTRRERFFAVIRHLLTGIVVGGGLFMILNFLYDSPYEKQMRKENELLRSRFELTEKRLDEALKVMDNIQQRDNNLYRVILQAEPVSLQLRNAGINESRYSELRQLPDADLVISNARKIDQLTRQIYVQSNSFDEVVKLGKSHEERLRNIPAIQPISNKDLKQTASGYGNRIDPIYKTRKFHAGMDFTAAIGTPVYATGDGVVESAGWEQGYGNTININHGYGYKTKFAHLSKILVQRGNKVKRGQEIGLVGNSGKSTGPHLHYEVILKGQTVNPMNYYYLDLTPEEYDRMIHIAENQGQVMD